MLDQTHDGVHESHISLCCAASQTEQAQGASQRQALANQAFEPHMAGSQVWADTQDGGSSTQSTSRGVASQAMRQELEAAQQIILQLQVSLLCCQSNCVGTSCSLSKSQHPYSLIHGFQGMLVTGALERLQHTMKKHTFCGFLMDFHHQAL